MCACTGGCVPKCKSWCICHVSGLFQGWNVHFSISTWLMRNSLLFAHVGSISEPVCCRCQGPRGEGRDVSIYLQRQLIRCWENPPRGCYPHPLCGAVPGMRTGLAAPSTHIHPVSLPRVTPLLAFGYRTQPWDRSRVPSDGTCSLSLVRSGILQSSKPVVGMRWHRGLAECALPC